MLDPNQDGYVSRTAAGFSNDGYYVDEFELPMFGIPIVGNGDVLNDNQAGPNCGITDLTVDNRGFSVYGVLDNNNNLIFRFRIGDDNPSVESYTILIDTDGKIGPDDPNATANNPGFEIDITLIKNSNKGVYVYNLDGIQSCPTPEFNYSFASNFQISIADIVSCGDPDYFYDYFVPFGDIATRFGVSGLTEMRFVAVTNISATCAMGGKISDVGGVDDRLYGGCNTCAFLDLVNNQCPTAVADLCPTCAGFLTGVTPKPTINTPLKVGEFTATGTSVANADIFMDVFNAARILKEQKTAVADPTGNWIVNLAFSLQLGDSVTAKARAPGLCSSGSLSSGASFTIVVQNQAPVLTAGSSVLIYNENDPPLRINGALTIADPDDTELESATIVISNNYVSGQDVLTFTPVPGVTGSFIPGSGSITFTGTATLTQYQTLLRSIHYSNTSENPSTLQRTVTMRVNDGLDNSNIVSRLINVISVNDPPVAVNDTGITNEDTPVTLLNITANDTDVDGTINPATVDLDPSIPGIQNSFSNAQGSWTVNAAGDVTYTPFLNFNGTATRSYTVQDNQGAVSSPANIIITVIPVNDPPVANNDSGSTLEDTPVTLTNITANDTDVDGTVNAATVDLDPLTPGIQNTFTNAQGSWSVNGSGDVTYTPALNFNGITVRNYTVNDNLGATSAPATITITVISVNDAPVAVDDIGVTNEDTPVTLLAITSNDTDVDGTIDAATVDLDLVTAGIQNFASNAFGSWSVNAVGDLTYTPVLNFNGVATKQYRVNDNQGATSNVATITITVNPVNDPPVANDDSGVTYIDTPVTLNNVTANDTDIDGTVDPSTVDLDPGLSGIQNVFVTVEGNWSVDAGGNVTFAPALSFSGTSVITYTVRDNGGATSGPANISVIVSGIDPGSAPPTAVNDGGNTNEDVPVTLNIVGNDTFIVNPIDPSTVDLNLNIAGIQNTFTNAQGTWSVNASGDLTYTPLLNLNGVVTKQYTVQDIVGRTSNAATITITVNPINDAPTAVDDFGVTDEDTQVTLLNVTANDTDVDDTVNPTTVDLDPLTPGIQNNVTDAQGNWSVNGAGDVTYSPALNYNGVAIRSYTVNDNAGATSSPANINITVNPINDAPVAVNDIGVTNEETLVILLAITSNDFDVDGTVNAATVDLDLLTAGIQNSIINTFGSWSVNALGDLTFTPVLNFNGLATVQYRVNDNLGLTSGPATVTITVNAVNDSPIANNDVGATNEDTPTTLIDITANDTDIDGTIDPATVDLNPLSIGIQNAFINAQGDWSVNGSGDVTYTPALNFNGLATINYVVNDNQGAVSSTASITITVNPVNDPPSLVDLIFSTQEEVALNESVFDLNDVDPEATALFVDTSPSLDPTHGEIVINVDGTFTYTPDKLFSGQEMIGVRICDEGLPLPSVCATKLITITVTPVNHSPQTYINGVPGGVITVTTNEDTPIVACFESVDPDGDDVSLSSVVNLEGGGTLTLFDNIEFCFEFIPEKDFNGLVRWEITVCDDGTPSLCGIVLLEINVLPVNDPPTAVRDSINVFRNEISFGNVMSNDFDIEGDQFAAEGIPVVMPLHGVALLNTDGSFSYQSERTFRGIDSLVYRVCDVGLPPACSEGTLIIVVGDRPLRPYEGLTPNGDGNNDYWRIDGIDFYTENKVRVFDRFNNLVFEMFGYDNENKIWKGEANHGMATGSLPEATYFYNIDLGDGSAPIGGFVVLKRK